MMFGFPQYYTLKFSIALPPTIGNQIDGTSSEWKEGILTSMFANFE